MKLKFDFDYIEIDGMMYALPVGIESERFKGLFEINEDTKEALKLIKESSSPEEVIEKLLKNHPNEDREKLNSSFCDFLNMLLKKGFLEP